MKRAAFGLLCITAASAGAQAKVAIAGNDYAFVGFPKTIAAGPTLFSFENKGKFRHELSLGLLRAGVTMQQVAERGQGISGRAVTDSIVGILIARPGEPSGGQLFVNLLPGRSYIVVCTLKDQPDAKPHVELGMIASFTVP
jgi:hypothetical protein